MPFQMQNKSKGSVFNFYTISRGSIESNLISKIETNLNIYLTVLTRFVDKKVTFINEA